MMLTALQAQLELGDLTDIVHDYRPIACHCLPARMVPILPQEGVAMHHQSLRGMTPSEAKQAFLNLIQSWPLHKATIFDVMVSYMFKAVSILQTLRFSAILHLKLASSTMVSGRPEGFAPVRAQISQCPLHL